LFYYYSQSTLKNTNNEKSPGKVHILEEMKQHPDFVEYTERENVIKELEQVITIFSELKQQWNRLNRIVLGIPSVGKSYLLRTIAVHAGFHFSNLLVVYIDCRRVEFTPIYVIVGEIAKTRGIFEKDYQATSWLGLKGDLRKKGLKLVLFLDELQQMYPLLGVDMPEEELRFKIDFIQDIASFCNSGSTLVIAAGSSISLSDLLYHHASQDKRVGLYPNMNSDKLQLITLLPIMKQNEFQNALNHLGIDHVKSSEEVEKLYFETGGVIGYLKTGTNLFFSLLEKNYEKLSRSLIGKVELISVLHYLYKMNQDPSTGKVNPFERMFANETELLEVVHEMNEEFHPSHFKFWADQGFLMMNRDHEYSYLMLAVLMKILTVGEKHISLVESTALQYPFGNLATLFESIFAEGLECNLLKKQLTGIYTVPNLNLENLSIEFIVNHVNIVYKIHPDLYGNGKFNCLT
jgi:hypothetical protein